MGAEVVPHGVVGGGSWARGVNGGEGRAPRPVPPIMAMRMGSFSLDLLVYQLMSQISRGKEVTRLCML